MTSIKEAPYSWFSSKHFLYRSESSRDSRVETSRSGEILKKLYLSLFFSLYRSNSRCLFFSLVMRVWNLSIVLLNRFPDSFQWFCVFPFSLMFCKIRSNFFDLYCSFADYNKHILCTSLRQLKVSLKLTYYVLLFNTMHMYSFIEIINKHVSNSTKVRNNKTKNTLTIWLLQH